MSTIAIVGRPNVGKSTLFNRIIGGRHAIVDDKPGVTRDRIYGSFDWRGKTYTLIDTGGFVPDSKNVFEKAIREQAQYAVDEADAIILVVDGSAGPHPIDKELANILRKKSKKVVLVVNKIDDLKHEKSVAQFSELGFSNMMGVSAQLGRNVGDFLDETVKTIPDSTTEIDTEGAKRIAIIGKPNVGKSSLVNLLLGENRSIVTDVPGTTRDSVDTALKFNGEELILVDTAGLRKKSKIKESVEFFSTLRTFQAVERCDVAIVLFDASVGVEKQDLQIVDYTIEQGKPVIIGVNKWDLVDKKGVTTSEYEEEIKKRLRILDFVPVLFISVTKNLRVQKLLSNAVRLIRSAKVKLKTSELNDYLLPLIERTPPFSKTGKEIRIKYITQVDSKLPTFAMFTNLPEEISITYRRFLENRIREKFGFQGVPIRLVFKQK
ncbi:MAG TPA: ribosome biogenesis GTPase Der [Candidatus Kryptonia bacterium]